jgi:hypothetical protein
MWFDEIVPLLPYIRDVGGTKQSECPLCTTGLVILEPYSEDHRQGNVKCIGTRGLNKCDYKALNSHLNQIVKDAKESGYYKQYYDQPGEYVPGEEEVFKEPEPAKNWPQAGERSENGHHPPESQAPIETRESPSITFPLIGFKELCSLPPPVWQIEDFFQEESLVQIFGASGHTKSLFTLDCGLSVCAGTEKWFGRKVNRHGPVVWVNADGGRGLTLRAQAWAEAHGIDELPFPFLTLMGSVQLNRPEQMAAFQSQLAAMDPKPALVVFDTLSRCIPGVDENATGEMTKVTENCHRLKLGLGATVVLIHHTDKTGQWERGSGVVKNESDTQIRVTKDPGTGISTVSCRKSREGSDFEDFHFCLKPVGQSVVVVATELPEAETQGERKEHSIDEVLFAIETKPGLTRPQVALMLNLSPATTHRYVDTLIFRGDVIELDGPWTPGQRGRPPKGLYPKRTQGDLISSNPAP